LVHRRTSNGLPLGGGRRGPDTVTFALLTFLLVLAAVAVLFVIFYLVRRWL
jgi:hypothetical protein